MVDRNQRKYNIEKILVAPDGGVSKTRGIGGILAALWRIMLRDLAISPNRFDNFLSDYIELSNRRLKASRVDKRLTRGNLRRALEKETMTFKVFITAMKVLKLRRFTLIFVLEHTSGLRSTHQLAVELATTRYREGHKLLSEFCDQLKVNLNITEEKFEKLLTQYVIAAKRSLAGQRLPRQLTRSGWRRELEKDTMSWRTLMKVFKFLNVSKFRLIIQAEHDPLFYDDDQLVSVHETSVDIGGVAISQEIYNPEEAKENDDE